MKTSRYTRLVIRQLQTSENTARYTRLVIRQLESKEPARMHPNYQLPTNSTDECNYTVKIEHRVCTIDWLRN